MPRPKTKSELLDLSAQNFGKLIELIENSSDEELHQEFPVGYLNRNIRDVIAHLHHWHKLTLGWYEVGLTGEKPDIPAKGYTWKTLPDFNRLIWNKYREMPLAQALQLLNESYREMNKLIESLTDEELFEKKRYKWTGTTSLGAYLISSTSSHYDWALKLIKKCRKEIAKT